MFDEMQGGESEWGNKKIWRAASPPLVSTMHPLDRTPDRSITRSIARSNVQISNYGYSGELFWGSNFELLACIIFISPVSEFRFTFKKNYDRTCLLFWGIRFMFDEMQGGESEWGSKKIWRAASFPLVSTMNTLFTIAYVKRNKQGKRVLAGTQDVTANTKQNMVSRVGKRGILVWGEAGEASPSAWR